MKNYPCTPMHLMLEEIADTHPITAREEKQLFLEYSVSSTRRRKEIKTKIIKANMRFILEMALHYKHIKGISIPDLVSEGKIGLLKAFDKFDKSKNLKFITYAVWWIKSKIGKYVEDNDLIRLPTYQKQRLNREKRRKEVKNLSKDMYYLHEITNIHLSLNDCVKGSKMPIAETIKDDRIEDVNKIYFNEKWKESLKKFLSEVLTEEEFIVISNLYGINTGYPVSLRDVRDIVDKSHERVRQIRDKALRTLRKSYHVEDFKKMLCEVTDG